MTVLRMLFAAPRSVVLGGLFVAGLLIVGCGSTEYPNCANDDECHSNEHCVNGQCQQCRDDSDCSAGQQCNGGRCEPIPGWCGSDADCPPGQQCINNQCVAAGTDDSIPGGPVACSLNSVHFQYDSHELDSSTRNTLEANAQCITERSIPQVTLTGHCDPRGTEEYNLALGERRARGVQTYLQRLGVRNGIMTSRSMGEEMARGSSESSWGQDRRVEIEER